MDQHLSEVDLIGLSDSLNSLVRNKEMLVQHFQLIGRLHQVFLEDLQLPLDLSVLGCFFADMLLLLLEVHLNLLNKPLLDFLQLPDHFITSRLTLLGILLRSTAMQERVAAGLVLQSKSSLPEPLRGLPDAGLDRIDLS